MSVVSLFFLIAVTSITICIEHVLWRHANTVYTKYKLLFTVSLNNLWSFADLVFTFYEKDVKADCVI